MKGIALMVKNIDGAPIRKGILKAGLSLKPRSLSDDLRPDSVPNGMGSSSKVESLEVVRKIANTDPENSKASSSKATMVTHNSFEPLNQSVEIRGEVVMETDGAKSVNVKTSQNIEDPLSEEDDVEEVYNEMSEFMTAGDHTYDVSKGASTPSPKESSMDEERFLKQKSKVNWLATGDANTSFFHMSLKTRNHKSRVDIVRDTHGVTHEGGEVPKAFVNHYEEFLGCEGVTGRLPTPDLFVRSLDHQLAAHMVRPVTFEEIKETMFSFSDDKAPGPDGYTAAFFKKAWNIVGHDVSLAIQDFFLKGKLLEEISVQLKSLWILCKPLLQCQVDVS
ncbi:hypothetical protein QVD17_39886 [Tagetes erecta]|uniref:RNA-directed DNA polymerase, eukaryota, reverse transcriptase zinc-binding domain protein n=1 Tax=Tagetes erecta TaxID=13708 RepID=A0AAD8JVD5_TARER|nr:hypothetical protein QVD17_39886 [Tagetes erecta]